jgi:hypothetical protein
MKKTNFEMALFASHGAERPFAKRIFGRFTAKGVMGTDEHFAFEAARYAYVGSPLALQLWVSDGKGDDVWWEPYICLTANVRPNSISSLEIIVKTYEENAHMREALLGLGFFEDTGQRMSLDFNEVEIWRLTEMFEDAFDTAHQEHEFA